MIIVCGFDHAGFPLKAEIISVIEGLDHQVIDVGTFSTEPVDYPDIALALTEKIITGPPQRGILVCGSGAGVAVAANKVHSIRAATIHDGYTAHQAVEHDDVNVLCMGARVVGSELAGDIVRTYLGAKFSGAQRHVRRLAKVRKLEDQLLTPPFQSQ